MSDFDSEIAKIESTFLGYEDHGILTAYIKWEDLVGRTVFVLREKAYGPIIGIRPLPTENGKEFLFSAMDELFAKYKKEES